MTIPFVGRARELELLEADLTDSLSGRGRFALLLGEPGIGKTRLADRIAERAAQRGAAVHWGRCWQGGGAPSFWPWVQILRSCARAPLGEKEAAGVSWTDGQIATLVGRTPTEAADNAATAPAMSGDHARFRLFDTVTGFLHAHAREHPQFLVLDDLHDADEASLLLLRFLARDLRSSSIGILATCREAEVQRIPMLASAFAGLVREGRCVRLGGLERDEVVEAIDLVSSAAFDDRVKDAVCRMTEGNPFFVDEVVRVLLSRPAGHAGGRIDIPFTVVDAVRQRLGPVAAPTLALLEAAAVIGREFDRRLLSRLVSRGQEDCLALLEGAVREGLIEPLDGEGREWRFVHVLIRETLRGDCPPASRRRLSLRIAGLLAEDRANGHPVHRSSLAHHLVEALPLADLPVVLEALLESGREAMAMLAYEDAAKDFESAIDILEKEFEVGRSGGDFAATGDVPAGIDPTPPGVTAAMTTDAATRFAEILLELGHARRCSGDLGAARRTFAHAASLLRSHLGEVDHSSEVAPLFARSVLGFGRVSETGRVDAELLSLLQEAIVAVGEDDSPLHASLLARQAMALYFVPGSDRCLVLGRRAVEIAERTDDPWAHTNALVALHFVLWRPGTASERLGVADTVIERCARSGEREALLEARLWRITDLVELGEIARALEERRRYETDAEAARIPNHHWQSAMLRSSCAWLEGRFGEAESEAERAFAIGSAAGLPNAQAFHAAQLYQLRGSDGRLPELEPLLRAVAAAIPAMPVWAVGAAEAALAAGCVEEARRDYQRVAAGGFDAVPRDGMWLTSIALLSRLAAKLGDSAGAARLHGLLSPYAGLWVVSVTAITVPGPVRLFLGMLCGVMGDTDGAVAHFRAAADECRRHGFRTLVAQCESEIARLAYPAQQRTVAEARTGVAARSPVVGDPGRAVEEAVFHRGTDFWTLAADGRALRLRDSKGLRYIHYLLQNPEQDIHVLDLVTAVEGSLPSHSGAAEMSNHAGEGDTGPVVDGVALTAYRRRLRELRAELAEAESNNDSGRVEGLRVEFDFLSRELVAAVGLGGRQRRSGSPSERTRVRVTKVIGLAMRRIRDASPVLGRVLSREIHTGTFCAYRPDPDRPVRWITQSD